MRSLGPITALLLFGCNFSQAGINPTENTLNFPMALALSDDVDPATGGARYLYVANSNFDLRFNAGSLWALDLDAMEDQVLAGNNADADACPLDTDAPNCELWPLETFDDGASDRPIDESGVTNQSVPIISQEVGIGSHADGLALSVRGDRLYLPMRGDRDLTFVPIDQGGGGFNCDQATRENEGEPDIPRCADRFRAGHDGGVASERELTITGSPTDVVTGRIVDIGGGQEAAGDFVLMSLDDGRVALFLDRHEGGDNSPELVHIADGFPTNVITMAIEPSVGIAWMTSVGTSTLARVGISIDPVNPRRSFLYNAGSVRLGGVDDGEDTRDFVFHPTDPSRAFVLSRRPEAVVEIAVNRRGFTQSDVAVVDLWEVGAGPSRLDVAEIDGTTYAFASCFDAQRLFVIDVDAGALIGVLGGFSGPFDIVVDAARERLYMADFSTSVIRVVDLSALSTGGAPRIQARFGELRPISSLTD